MSFLGSLFLWALPLVAVPVILHLLRRRQREIVPWGAMQFLAPEIIHQRKMKRIDELLLMILRTLAIAGIILAMAQPMISGSLFGFGSVQEEVVLVIDVSLSTDLATKEQSLFDELREAVREELEELENGTQVRLLLAGERPEWMYPTALELSADSRARINEDLNQLEPTLASAQLGSALLLALESKPDQNIYLRRIELFTDGFAEGWEADSSSLWQKIRKQQEQASVPTSIKVWTPNKQTEVAHTNISIEEIRSLRTHVALDELITFTAVVRNRGNQPVQNISLDWSANGTDIGSSSISNIEPGETAEVDFDYATTEQGIVRIECKTPLNDELRLDNRSERLLSVVERIPLLIVSRVENLHPPKGDVRLVLSALGQSQLAREINHWKSVFVPKVISWEELEGENLDTFDCLLLTEVPNVSESAIQNLTRFVRNGGGLWIIPGPGTNFDSFNASFHRGGAGLAPLPLSGLRSESPTEQPYDVLIPPERSHPALNIIGDLERLDIHEVRLTEYIRQSAPDNFPGNRIWLQTASGDPLVVENYLGRGRVIVQSIPLNLDWSNLPICRLYVAMVQEWLLYLAQPSASQLNLEPGETFRFSTTAALNLNQLEVETPLHQMKRPALLNQEGESRLFFAETNWPGAYQLNSIKEDGQPELLAPFYVARNREESNLTPLNEPARQHLAELGGLQFGEQSTTDLTRYEQAEPPQTPFWTQLLMLALICFAAEMILTLFIARRRYAGSLGPE
ncbi:MAG: BatA domain-containing protein [Planctomycetaceae bacterium]|nr:BatA domain-containing protein [Planctomycetaceae bacterium]